jgi:hypothetical protein
LSQASIRETFPRLKRARFAISSPQTPSYNCIAFAAQDTQRWWWPSPSYYYWPPDVDRAEDLQAFIAAFATLGYEPCADGSAERGFEKVALFADAQGKPQHAATQLPSGRWTSKLGNDEDINHSIYGLEGGRYGDVAQYLRRKISPPAAKPEQKSA